MDAEQFFDRVLKKVAALPDREHARHRPDAFHLSEEELRNALEDAMVEFGLLAIAEEIMDTPVKGHA